MAEADFERACNLGADDGVPIPDAEDSGPLHDCMATLSWVVSGYDFAKHVGDRDVVVTDVEINGNEAVIRDEWLLVGDEELDDPSSYRTHLELIDGKWWITAW